MTIEESERIADSLSRVSMDWGAYGNYEAVAQAMLPAAETVIGLINPKPGQKMLDIGCGTGNAALLAAQCGAEVTGVDPSARLLSIARDRAEADGLSINFLQGTAEAVPAPDNSFDLVVDVFSLLFVANPMAAIAELVRVTASGGHIVWTGWVPEGAVVEVVKARQNLMERMGRARTPYSRWYDRDELTALFEPHSFSFEIVEKSFSYIAPSAVDWLTGTANAHPGFVLQDRFFEEKGVLEEAREMSLKILDEGNEDPEAFKVSPRFIVGVAKRKT